MSNDPVIKRPETNQLPFPIHDPGEELYRLAGITMEDRANLLKECFRVASESLHAMRIDRSSFRGKFLDSKQSIDYASRLRAIEAAQNLAGIAKGKEPKPQVVVHIVTPEWACLGSGGRVIDGSATPQGKIESVSGDDARHD